MSNLEAVSGVEKVWVPDTPKRREVSNAGLVASVAGIILFVGIVVGAVLLVQHGNHLDSMDPNYQAYALDPCNYTGALSFAGDSFYLGGHLLGIIGGVLVGTPALAGVVGLGIGIEERIKERSKGHWETKPGPKQAVKAKTINEGA